MKKFCLSILLVLGVLVFTNNLSGYFAFNETCKAFPDQCDRGGRESVTLGQLIIDGAGYFLQSNIEYQLFLKKVELSGPYGLNFPELQGIIDKAIENMELANTTYFQMWQTSTNLQYDQTVLDKLKLFNYRVYQKENNLNPKVFQEVEEFLKNGDVRGAYLWFYNRTGDILEKLEAIKASVDSNVFPELKKCWRLNQLILEAELFGQQVAEIFFEI